MPKNTPSDLYKSANIIRASLISMRAELLDDYPDLQQKLAENEGIKDKYYRADREIETLTAAIEKMEQAEQVLAALCRQYTRSSVQKYGDHRRSIQEKRATDESREEVRERIFREVAERMNEFLKKDDKDDKDNEDKEN